MSYKLNKPLSIKDRADFIVTYNHNKGLRIEESSNAIYALEDWEMLNESDEIIENINAWRTQQAKVEAERVAKLNLTAADVERGIYKAKGIDFNDILELVALNCPSGIDIKALKIELKANNFYRGNVYVDVIGNLLGLTQRQLDKFFETNDYTFLVIEEV